MTQAFTSGRINVFRLLVTFAVDCLTACLLTSIFNKFLPFFPPFSFLGHFSIILASVFSWRLFIPFFVTILVSNTFLSFLSYASYIWI